MSTPADPGLRPQLSPSSDEFGRRRVAVLEAAARLNADLFVGFDAAAIRYLTGYPVNLAERPFAVIVDANAVSLFVPLLSAEHARTAAHADFIEHYPEYPGRRHPMELLAELIAKRRPRRIIADYDGYADPRGYRGPRLSQLAGDLIVDSWFMQVIRMRKSVEEIALIRQAADWSVFAETLLEREVKAGRTESQVASAATSAAGAALRRHLPTDGRFGRPTAINADFGGQVGVEGTSRRFPPIRDPELRSGDPLITRVGAWIGGYYCDIERTLVVGQPSAPFAELFERGLELQAFAREMIRPGRAVSDIDVAVYNTVVRLGLEDSWQHHTGHSLGLYEREAPYIDVGATEVLEPGMVVTVEPGLYRHGVGGFRHSDCLLVTEGSSEVLTEHPRDLSSLTCE
jgi:Xaa-Pro aminopeptidase